MKIPDDQALEVLAMKKLIIFGEVKGNQQVVDFELEMIKKLKPKYSNKKLHIFLDHFTFEMQHLLDDFQLGKLTVDQLLE
jgi:uncharacterized iron-regulated protein